jgi:hypothetical protein
LSLSIISTDDTDKAIPSLSAHVAIRLPTEATAHNAHRQGRKHHIKDGMRDGLTELASAMSLLASGEGSALHFARSELNVNPVCVMVEERMVACMMLLANVAVSAAGANSGSGLEERLFARVVRNLSKYQEILTMGKGGTPKRRRDEHTSSSAPRMAFFDALHVSTLRMQISIKDDGGKFLDRIGPAGSSVYRIMTQGGKHMNNVSVSMPQFSRRAQTPFPWGAVNILKKFYRGENWAKVVSAVGTAMLSRNETRPPTFPLDVTALGEPQTMVKFHGQNEMHRFLLDVRRKFPRISGRSGMWLEWEPGVIRRMLNQEEVLDRIAQQEIARGSRISSGRQHPLLTPDNASSRVLFSKEVKAQSGGRSRGAQQSKYVRVSAVVYVLRCCNLIPKNPKNPKKSTNPYIKAYIVGGSGQGKKGPAEKSDPCSSTLNPSWTRSDTLQLEGPAIVSRSKGKKAADKLVKWAQESRLVIEVWHKNSGWGSHRLLGRKAWSLKELVVSPSNSSLSSHLKVVGKFQLEWSPAMKCEERNMTGSVEVEIMLRMPPEMKKAVAGGW